MTYPTLKKEIEGKKYSYVGEFINNEQIREEVTKAFSRKHGYKFSITGDKFLVWRK